MATSNLNHPNRSKEPLTEVVQGIEGGAALADSVTTGTELDIYRDLVDTAGQGLEGARIEELVPPFLVITHKQSPFMDRHHEMYVEGGRDGDFFDTLGRVYFDGETK